MWRLPYNKSRFHVLCKTSEQLLWVSDWFILSCCAKRHSFERSILHCLIGSWKVCQSFPQTPLSGAGLPDEPHLSSNFVSVVAEFIPHCSNVQNESVGCKVWQDAPVARTFLWILALVFTGREEVSVQSRIWLSYCLKRSVAGFHSSCVK